MEEEQVDLHMSTCICLREVVAVIHFSELGFMPINPVNMIFSLVKAL